MKENGLFNMKTKKTLFACQKELMWHFDVSILKYKIGEGGFKLESMLSLTPPPDKVRRALYLCSDKFLFPFVEWKRR